jgi:hypothetical protein
MLCSNFVPNIAFFCKEFGAKIRLLFHKSIIMKEFAYKYSSPLIFATVYVHIFSSQCIAALIVGTL